MYICVWVCALVQCLGRPGDGFGFPGAEVKAAVKVGNHIPSPVRGVPVLKEVTGSSIYIFKQEPDCTRALSKCNSFRMGQRASVKHSV